MSDVFGVLPSQVGISNPRYEIFQGFPDDFGVDNFVDFVFQVFKLNPKTGK